MQATLSDILKQLGMLSLFGHLLLQILYPLSLVRLLMVSSVGNNQGSTLG